MWFLFALLHVFFLALVNYTDEYLNHINKVPTSANIHKRVGGVLLMSTLMSFVGAAVLWFITQNVSMPSQDLTLSLLSSIPMVLMWGSYFYLLNTYPVHQVVPLFQISSLWMLFIDLASGETVSIVGLFGISALIYGAYLLDVGSFQWKIPTKLLLYSIPATANWAIALFLARTVSEKSSAMVFTFWQLLGVGLIGTFLFVIVKNYREGFMYRIKTQGRNFLGYSVLNEGFAETSYLFSNLAVAISPIGAYVAAVNGVQSLFVFLLLFFFPLGQRAKPTPVQWFAVLLIAAGTFFIERG